MNWPLLTRVRNLILMHMLEKYTANAEYAESAKYAKYAAYAEYRENAKYAKYAKYVKPVNVWVRSAFGNVFSKLWTITFLNTLPSNGGVRCKIGIAKN